MLGANIEDTGVRLSGEGESVAWSEVCRLSDKDRGDGVPYGDASFIRQSSTSPVAPP